MGAARAWASVSPWVCLAPAPSHSSFPATRGHSPETSQGPQPLPPPCWPPGTRFPCHHREHPALRSLPLYYHPPPSTGLPRRRLEGGMSIEGKNVGEEERAEGARTPGPPPGTLEQQGIVRRGASSPHHLAPSHLNSASLSFLACEMGGEGPMWQPHDLGTQANVCWSRSLAPGRGQGEQRPGSTRPAGGGAPEAGGGPPGRHADGSPGEAEAPGRARSRRGTWGRGVGGLLEVRRSGVPTGRSTAGLGQVALGTRWPRSAHPGHPPGRAVLEVVPVLRLEIRETES